MIKIFRQYPVINGFMRVPQNLDNEKTKYIPGNHVNNPVGLSLVGLKGFNGNGEGWNIVQNGAFAPVVVNDVLQITSVGTGSTKNAFWNSAKLFTGKSFDISFTYRCAQSSGQADGMTFTVQNDPAGLLAVGNQGSGLGYVGLTKSFAYAIDVYSGSTGTRGGTGLSTDGAPFTFHNFQVADLVNMRDTHPKNVRIQYDAVLSTFTETVVDATNSNTYIKTYTGINLRNIIGADEAYYGFTGATGGSKADQYISNFNIAIDAFGSLDNTQTKVVTIKRNTEYVEFLASQVSAIGS